jgi:hypothetical protein
MLAEPPRGAQQKLTILTPCGWLPAQVTPKKENIKKVFCANLVKQQQPTSILIGCQAKDD